MDQKIYSDGNYIIKDDGVLAPLDYPKSRTFYTESTFRTFIRNNTAN